MMIVLSNNQVIISNAESKPNDFGETKQSTVYHYAKQEWQCGTARNIKEPVEIDEAIAKAFGRSLCAMCYETREREDQMDVLNGLVQNILKTDWMQLVRLLPSHLEVRIYAHGVKKQPLKIWSSYHDI